MHLQALKIVKSINAQLTPQILASRRIQAGVSGVSNVMMSYCSAHLMRCVYNRLSHWHCGLSSATVQNSYYYQHSVCMEPRRDIPS